MGMKIYKIAQSNPLSLSQAVDFVFKQISVGSRYKSGTGRVTKDNINITFSDAMGEAHIQVFFDEANNLMGVHKYYENEMVNDDYREERTVPLDIANPTITANAINTIILQWMGGIRK